MIDPDEARRLATHAVLLGPGHSWSCDVLRMESRLSPAGWRHAYGPAEIERSRRKYPGATSREGWAVIFGAPEAADGVDLFPSLHVVHIYDDGSLEILV